jgi:hypothetical protein
MWAGVQLPKNHRFAVTGVTVRSPTVINFTLVQVHNWDQLPSVSFLSIPRPFYGREGLNGLSFKDPSDPCTAPTISTRLPLSLSRAALFHSRAVLASSRFLFVSRTASLLSRAVLTSLRFLFSISSIKDDIPRELLLLWAFTMFSLRAVLASSTCFLSRAVFLPRPVDICLSYQFWLVQGLIVSSF